MTIINRDSFVATEVKEETYGRYEYGTVEVTFRGRTERTKAYRSTNRSCVDIKAYGAFSGRYQTGTKAWPATVTSRDDGKKVFEFVDFGRDDRAAKFNKMNCIFWAI